MKLSDLLMAKPVLDELMRQRLNGRLAYQMVKNSRMINEELQAVEAGRRAIFERLSVDGHTIPDDKLADANGEFEELIQQEIDLDLYTLAPDDLAVFTLTPAQVDLIMFLVDEAGE